MCPAHYRRHRLGLDVEAPLKGDLTECTVEDCDRPIYAKLMCSLHYSRIRLTGDVGPVGVKRRHKVGKWTDSNSGYVYIEPWFTGLPKRTSEHRFVMEQHLGRPLWPDETVHHRNGDRSDNRLSNLELWSSWQPAGQRIEDKLQWAREILARYE